jgi:hypothetical protein
VSRRGSHRRGSRAGRWCASLLFVPVATAASKQRSHQTKRQHTRPERSRPLHSRLPLPSTAGDCQQYTHEERHSASQPFDAPRHRPTSKHAQTSSVALRQTDQRIRAAGTALPASKTKAHYRARSASWKRPHPIANCANESPSAIDSSAVQGPRGEREPTSDRQFRASGASAGSCVAASCVRE